MAVNLYFPPKADRILGGVKVGGFRLSSANIQILHDFTLQGTNISIPTGKRNIIMMGIGLCHMMEIAIAHHRPWAHPTPAKLTVLSLSLGP